MAFTVTKKKWLEVETERVQSIILMPKYWHRAWTAESLHQELTGPIGLAYTLAEVQEINEELHKAKVVEDMADPGPEPEPAPAAEETPG
jgi:hypothetical protein